MNGKISHSLQFPDYRGSVALKYVKRGFQTAFNIVPAIGAIVVAGFGAAELLNLWNQGELHKLWNVALQTELTFDLITVIGCTSLVAVAILAYFMLQSRPVFLLDFQVYKAPDSWAAPATSFLVGSRDCKKFTEESLVFQEKIMARSGLGSNTYLPPAVHAMPPCPSMKYAREEFEHVMFSCVDDLLKKTGIHPKQIGILVVNCSLFNPTPSLSAMVINHFKMRSNIISYNLSGMGCSCSPIAIDLARQMLQLYPSSYALVLSTENITQNWYFGNERSMLMPNCLFRVGGAAMLLTNKKREYFRSKYQLLHTVRTHLGARDDAYNCIFQCEDEAGTVGVRLSKELMAVAGEALKVNVTTLGPLVLPISEQLIFICNLVLRKVFRKKLKPYIPDFNTAFHHICIHTGGRAVIDEIEKQLKLGDHVAEPSRATLYRYGNVSSSSIWYCLAYMESIRGVRCGDKVWQLGFGSGFKCNSAVWKSLRRIKDVHPAWDGFDVDEMRDYLNSLPNHHNAGKKTQ
ncbi:hypothetical protein CEUSTIGMA_g5886.t1 [Chlamydomonas eustigma]|uniref:3-ketoacyl-CoA synthase n=1 Tax=Chlamydomonas eustigma TaxID=1157962 RepID=A0A250X5T9_9CHLO|nr:hypothetical protein CEUSTIGMA_g5886.t1 [Chlamydomonas eustigma]|eukprot:GAX78445.1 hypothetical protein CEUSTIGMA_g5886.t1 [Chlamydomonas eustigma]